MAFKPIPNIISLKDDTSGKLLLDWLFEVYKFLNKFFTGNIGIKTDSANYVLDVNGSFGFNPGNSVTPVNNGDIVVQATNNTTLTFKLKGSDGTIRTGTITLS